MSLLRIADLENQLKRRDKRMHMLQASIDQMTGTTYNVCFVPMTPTEVMISAATAHGVKCQAEGIIPTGKSYYEAMILAYLMKIPAYSNPPESTK